MAPTIYATALFDKLDELLLEFGEQDKETTAGIASVGPAAAYAEVWEWGNVVRQTKPGPKTVLGINPDGERVWLTIQAPFGYIKVNENQYWDILKDELRKVRFESHTTRGISEELEAAAVKAMKRIVKIIRDTAPVDTGALRKSFTVILPGDALLENDDSDRTLTIGMEED